MNWMICVTGKGTFEVFVRLFHRMYENVHLRITVSAEKLVGKNTSQQNFPISKES